MSERLREKCALFGVYGKGMHAARLTYFGLYALQHRGQESSGIASSNGKNMYFHKSLGLVAQVYNEENLKKLKGHIAIGHNRYATSGGAGEHAQPVVARNDMVALAHNGNLPTTQKLSRFLSTVGLYTKGQNDSELMHTIVKYFLVKKYTLEDAIVESVPYFTGAYCLLVMTKNKMVALRDPYGIRPLSIGKLNGGYIVASETCALDTVNATFIRDVHPGEMVVFDEKGMHSLQYAEANQKLDIFEFIYFARPDSTLLGKKVYDVRKNLGKALAKEVKLKADVVIPVPDSAIPAAIGFSESSNIPFEFGLVKNRYIGRTFIMPDQKLRDRGVQMKLNLITELIRGKRVVLIDDSIVRGTTSKKLVKMIRDAGAKEVHLLSSCPPVRFPDFYGINTPTQKELIASHASVAQIRNFIGADSLHFLSYKETLQAIGIEENRLCTSCFTGVYPIDIGKHIRLLKDAKVTQFSPPVKRQENIAVFISNKGTGSNLKALIDAKKQKKLKGTIRLVISDKQDAKGLAYATTNNIPYMVMPLNDKTKRHEYGIELANILNQKNISIVVFAGFMTILPSSYFSLFKGLTLNIHPGVIPDQKNKPFRFPDGSKAPWNQGLMTTTAVANFLKYKYAGSTIHVVTQEADFGPVLERRIIKTTSKDTIDTLYARLKKEEQKALISSINKLTQKQL